MKLEEILLLSDYQLPAINSTGEPFVAFAEERIEQFIAHIRSSKADLFDGAALTMMSHTEFLQNIEALGKGLIAVIRKAKTMASHEAYPMFKALMEEAGIFMFSHKGALFPLSPTEILYRAKVDDKALKSQDYFFHAPFDKSDYVSSTRFALPGYPAIYLANSLVGCYRELDCEMLKGFQAVKYQSARPLPFLDLDYNRPNALLKTTNLAEYDMQLQAKAIIYPLLLCCNTQKKSGAAASSEYIIPQFLLRWIKESGGMFYGIKYPSTRIMTPPNEGSFYNLVIPPITEGDKGHCHKLKKLLKLSQPCGFDQHYTDADNYFNSNFGAVGFVNDEVQQIEWDSKVIAYPETELGKMEFYLRNNFMTDKPVW